MGDSEGMTAPSLRDDTCLVYRFDADDEDAFWLVRQLMEQWLRERNVRSEAVGDLVLVTAELCTGATAGVVLRAEVEDGGVELSVESAAGAPVDRPTGDLRLAAAFCDEVVIRCSPTGAVVRARRHGVVLPE